MKNIALFSLIICAMTVSIISAQNFWEETNGPEGGFVQCLAVNKSGIMFAGFQAGTFGTDHHGRGLYKSDNLGVSWQLIDINSNKDVQSITIDTSGTIYIWVLGGGVLKSTDNGINWVLSSPGWLSDGIISSFKNNYLILGTQDGIYFSTDSGENWILNSLTGSIKFIYVDEDDDAFVYVNYGDLYKTTDYGSTWITANYGLPGGVLSMVQVNNSELFAGTYNGTYVSRDKGENWYLLLNSPIYVTALSSGENGELYAGTSTTGFYFSTNHGSSWTKSNNGLNCYSSTAILKVSDDQLVLGTHGDGIFSSSDRGRNWNSINSSIKSVTITSFMKFKDYLFAGSEQGIIYKTSDRGDTWEMIDSIYTELEINCFAQAKTGSMFFSSNNGIFKSTNEGISWFKISNSFANKMATFLDTISNSEYIFAVSSTGIRRSTDDGNTWITVNNGILNFYLEDLKTNTLGFVFTANDDEIYRSTDYGLNWEVIYECPISAYHTCLTVSSNDYIYAGFDFGKVILSTDYGDTWIDRGQNLPINRVNSITSDLQNSIYAGNWNGQIYQSTDNGEDWIDIRSGTIGGPILNLYCDDIGNIFVGPFGGSVYRGINNTILPSQVILYSPPSGSENQPLNPELKWFSSPLAENYRIQVALTENFDSTAIVYDLSTLDTTIIIGPLSELTRYYWRVSGSNQFGSGSWSNPWNFTTVNTTGITDPPNKIYSFNLNQNYPNPFNPGTKIKFIIPSFIANGVRQTQFVTLKVYDVLGNEVSTLVNEEKSAGEFEVEFNGSNIPSGIYFYQLKAGNYIETKKMILIK